MRVFIGREEALSTLLGDLLGNSPYFIGNLHGIGGIGKTTLKAEVLLRLQEAAPSVALLHADEQTARSDLGEFIGALTDSFYWHSATKRVDFPRVRQAKLRLRELKSRLMREREAEILGCGLKTALSGVGRRALFGRLASDESSESQTTKMPPNQEEREVAPEFSVSSGVIAGITLVGPSSSWGRTEQQAYERAVATWTRDRDDQELLLDPLATFTRALLGDLIDIFYPPPQGLFDLLASRRDLSGAPAKLVVAIDSYEALETGIHEWLLAHVLPGVEQLCDLGRRYRELIDFRLLLCGRESLLEADALRRWDGYRDRIRLLGLDRFSVAQVAEYLAARGMDRELAEKAHSQTHGVPFILAIWCDAGSEGQARAVARATRRLYWWKSPQEIRWLKAGAFLTSLDRDRLGVMLSDPIEASSAYDWLAQNGEVAVSDQVGCSPTIRLHPVVADLIRSGLALESPVEFQELARRADIVERAVALRNKLGFRVFNLAQKVSPLRWFDPEILADVAPFEATAILSLVETSPDTLVPFVGVEGAYCLGPEMREVLMTHWSLRSPKSFHDALATFKELASGRLESWERERSRSIRLADSKQGDAAVMRQRAAQIEAKVSSLQAREHAAIDALEYAKKALPDPKATSRRTPWWATATSGALGSIAAFGSLPLLSEFDRLWGWSVGGALLVLSLGCASRALWLPPLPSGARLHALWDQVDSKGDKLADLQGKVSEALLELSTASREADQLQAEANSLSAEIRDQEPSFI